MTLLSRKTDYALLILAYLHTHRDGGCARTIAESYGISKAFIANILKELCQKGFVASHRGVNGGYALERSTDEINLAELLESLEDGFRLTNCNGHEHSMDEDEEECAVLHRCPIKGAIGDVHRRILETLRSVTLTEIFQSSQPATTYQPLLATLGLREPAAAAMAT